MEENDLADTINPASSFKMGGSSIQSSVDKAGLVKTVLDLLVTRWSLSGASGISSAQSAVATALSAYNANIALDSGSLSYHPAYSAVAYANAVYAYAKQVYTDLSGTSTLPAVVNFV